MADLPFGHRPADDRVPTYCDDCGQIDTHPKHHVYDQADQRFESHHHDCGAASGCQVCAESEALTGGKRGDDLIAHVTTASGAPSAKHADALAQAVAAETPNVKAV